MIETFNLIRTFKKNMIQAQDIERCNIWHNLHGVIWSIHTYSVFHVYVKTSLFVFLCFVLLGHEALCVFQFVTKFSKICFSLLRVDIIFSWNICVRRISFVELTLWCLDIFSEWYVRTFCLMLYRFIYMGFDIAMEQHSWSHVGFIFFSIVSFLAHKLEV